MPYAAWGSFLWRALTQTHRQALVTARFVESFKTARSYFLSGSAPKIEPDLRVEEDEQVAGDFSRVFWCRLFATAHARS